MSDEEKTGPLVYHRPKAGDRLECENGPGCCWQTWDGHESLEADKERHALCFLSEPEPPKPPTCNGCGAECESRVCTGCSAPMLARALFETDRRVIEFVASVGDFHCYPAGVPEWDYDDDRRAVAMQKAWDRNERGWRTECQERARDITRELRAMSVPSGGGGGT